MLTRADVISMQNLKWISARCMPAAITDNVFAVMENNPLPINFPCRTARPGKENIPAELDIVLDMPEGFTLKTGIVMSKISEERKDGRVLWRFRNSNPAAVISPGDYRPHQALSFLISTMKKASSTLYPATYRLEYAGVNEGLPVKSESDSRLFRQTAENFPHRIHPVAGMCLPER